MFDGTSDLAERGWLSSEFLIMKPGYASLREVFGVDGAEALALPCVAAAPTWIPSAGGSVYWRGLRRVLWRHEISSRVHDLVKGSDLRRGMRKFDEYG